MGWFPPTRAVKLSWLRTVAETQRHLNNKSLASFRSTLTAFRCWGSTTPRRWRRCAKQCTRRGHFPESFRSRSLDGATKSSTRYRRHKPFLRRCIGRFVVVSYSVLLWQTYSWAEEDLKCCLHYGINRSKLGPFLNVENIFLCFKRH